MTGMIFDIERCSFVDGPGIRTTVFFKGCNLKCAWCHNPESQLPAPQMMYYKDQCKGCGKCEAVCPTPGDCTLCGKCTLYCPVDARRVSGKEYTVDEVFDEILKDKDFYENSGGGATFSGGECLLQPDFLLELLKKCKQKGIHTAVDTAGHVSFTHFEKILPYTDLILYDVKLMDSEKHRQFVGVDNGLILENLRKLLRAKANIWIRIPVVGGVNDSRSEMLALKAFLAENGSPEKIELLPYHAMGEHKYGAIGRESETFAAPEKELIEKLEKMLAMD